MKLVTEVQIKTYLSIEEFSITFELIAQSFVCLIHKLSFVSNSLEECIIYFTLDIIRMISCFFRLIVIKEGFHFFI